MKTSPRTRNTSPTRERVRKGKGQRELGMVADLIVAIISGSNSPQNNSTGLSFIRCGGSTRDGRSQLGGFPTTSAGGSSTDWTWRLGRGSTRTSTSREEVSKVNSSEIVVHPWRCWVQDLERERAIRPQTYGHRGEDEIR
ncbi:hypothetical protein J6590_001128 [Homalodisca vitripennis]|nr:hypothetical protein J6590_001128 [Homalodisca vitripennis]